MRRWSEPPNLDRPTRLFQEVFLGGLGPLLRDRRDVGLRRPQRRGARIGAEADLLG